MKSAGSDKKKISSGESFALLWRCISQIRSFAKGCFGLTNLDETMSPQINIRSLSFNTKWCLDDNLL